MASGPTKVALILRDPDRVEEWVADILRKNRDLGLGELSIGLAPPVVTQANADTTSGSRADVSIKEQDALYAAVERIQERLMAAQLKNAELHPATLSLRIRVASTLSDAIEGADVVIHGGASRVDPLRAVDEDLPWEFDVIGHETVGPGGFFAALRTIPSLLDVASIVAEKASAATLLVCERSLNLCLQAVADRFAIRAIGVPDEAERDFALLPPSLAPTDDLHDHVSCFGLHRAVFYTWSSLAQPSLDRIFRQALVADPSPKDASREKRFLLEKLFEVALHDRGYWPSRFVPLYTHTRDFLVQESSRRREARLNKTSNDKLPAWTPRVWPLQEAQEPPVQHGLLRVLHGLCSSSPQAVYVDVVNRGAIDLFADDTVIERRVELSAEGVDAAPRAMLPDLSLLPDAVGNSGATAFTRQAMVPKRFVTSDRIRDLLLRLEEHQRLTSEAATTSGFASLVRALSRHPLVGHKALAEEILERAARRYGPTLPQLL